MPTFPQPAANIHLLIAWKSRGDLDLRHSERLTGSFEEKIDIHLTVLWIELFITPFRYLK